MAGAALPKSSRERFDIAMRQAMRRLETEFEERVQRQSQENDEKLWKPYTNEKLRLYESVVAGREGVFHQGRVQ
jgi:hypothetical protein